MTVSLQNGKPAAQPADKASTVALEIEILAIVSCHIVGAGVGFMVQQQFARTAKTRVVTRDEVPELLNQTPYPFDMLVLEVDAGWSRQVVVSLMDHLRDTPVLILKGANAPDLAEWNLPQAKLWQLTLSAPHKDYAHAFTQALGMGQLEVASAEVAAKVEVEGVVSPAKLFMRLTARQRDVLHLMLQGMSNKEIASKLDLSTGTVKLHVSSLLKALNLRTRSQVQALASTADVMQNNIAELKLI